MRLSTTFQALGPIDMRNIRRDPILRWMLFAPILIGLILRFLLPYVSTQLLIWLEFDLKPYTPLLLSAFLMIIPSILGAVIGFLLLDQRDDRTLFALQVTPLSLNNYFVYRMMVPILLSFAGNVIFLLASGFCHFSGWEVILVSLFSSGMAALFALFYASFAANKVQGFALMKISGLIYMPVIAAWFVDPPWDWLFGILPPYWPIKLYWLLESGGQGVLLCLLGALASQVLALWFLLKKFKQVCEV